MTYLNEAAIRLDLRFTIYASVRCQISFPLHVNFIFDPILYSFGAWLVNMFGVILELLFQVRNLSLESFIFGSHPFALVYGFGHSSDRLIAFFL